MQPTSAASGTGDSEVRTLRLFVFALFFMFGGITSLNDVIIPKLKGLFTLSYAEVMLVQTSFFMAYLLISIPAAEMPSRQSAFFSTISCCCRLVCDTTRSCWLE